MSLTSGLPTSLDGGDIDRIGRIGRLIGRIIAQRIGRIINWLIGRIIGRLIGRRRRVPGQLAARYATRGCSPTAFQPRMARADIGNYLGLAIERIGRLLARFSTLAPIAVERRDATLLDPLD